MFIISFKVKKQVFRIKVGYGDDLLILLDKFVKKNKIDKSEIRPLKRIKISRDSEGSFISKSIVLTIIKTIELIKKYC